MHTGEVVGLEHLPCATAWRRDGTGGPKSRSPVLQRGHLEDGAGLFTAVHVRKMRESGQRLKQERIRLDFPVSSTKHCNSWLKEAVGSPSLETFKTQPGRSMSNCLSWPCFEHGVGPDISTRLCQSALICDSSCKRHVWKDVIFGAVVFLALLPARAMFCPICEWQQ